MWRLALQDGREIPGIDISPGQYYCNGLATHASFLLQQGSQGRGAGTFGDIVSIPEIDSNRLSHFVFVDCNEFCCQTFRTASGASRSKRKCA